MTRLGIPRSEETKAKISAALKKAYEDHPESWDKMKAPMKNETKVLLSANLKAKWSSGTRKAQPIDIGSKISAGQKLAHAEGRMHKFTKEASAKGLAARKPENMAAGHARRAAAKVGVPNPLGRSGACPENWCAKHWVITSPTGVVIEGKNLNDLIRTHNHLFQPSDVVWKKSRCLASKGIGQLLLPLRDGKLHPGRTWKGWKAHDKTSA